MTNQEIVVTFLNGFNSPEKLQVSLDLLADDYKFKDPIMEHNSKKEFVQAAKELAKVLTDVNVLRTAENGNWVGAFYEFKSSIPGLESNHASEWFRVENGVIRESQLIFDATGWRKVFEEIEH